MARRGRGKKQPEAGVGTTEDTGTAPDATYNPKMPREKKALPERRETAHGPSQHYPLNGLELNFDEYDHRPLSSRDVMVHRIMQHGYLFPKSFKASVLDRRLVEPVNFGPVKAQDYDLGCEMELVRKMLFTDFECDIPGRHNKLPFLRPPTLPRGSSRRKPNLPKRRPRYMDEKVLDLVQRHFLEWNDPYMKRWIMWRSAIRWEDPDTADEPYRQDKELKQHEIDRLRSKHTHVHAQQKNAVFSGCLSAKTAGTGFLKLPYDFSPRNLLPPGQHCYGLTLYGNITLHDFQADPQADLWRWDFNATIKHHERRGRRRRASSVPPPGAYSTAVFEAGGHVPMSMFNIFYQALPVSELDRLTRRRSLSRRNIRDMFHKPFWDPSWVRRPDDEENESWLQPEEAAQTLPLPSGPKPEPANVKIEYEYEDGDDAGDDAGGEWEDEWEDDDGDGDGDDDEDGGGGGDWETVASSEPGLGVARAPGSFPSDLEIIYVQEPNETRAKGHRAGCANCGQQTHRTRDCVNCGYCNSQDHVAPQCPKSRQSRCKCSGFPQYHTAAQCKIPCSRRCGNPSPPGHHRHRNAMTCRMRCCMCGVRGHSGRDCQLKRCRCGGQHLGQDCGWSPTCRVPGCGRFLCGLHCRECGSTEKPFVEWRCAKCLGNGRPVREDE